MYAYSFHGCVYTRDRSIVTFYGSLDLKEFFYFCKVTFTADCLKNEYLVWLLVELAYKYRHDLKTWSRNIQLVVV